MSQPKAPGRPALDVLERYQDAIVAELRAAVERSDQPPFTLMRYHLGWEDAQGRPIEGRGGKLLRPALLLLSCEAAGGTGRTLPSAARSVLHNFTLLRRRRGRQRAASWPRHRVARLGPGGGDQRRRRHVRAGALTLLRLGTYDAERVLAAARLLDEATLRLCEAAPRPAGTKTSARSRATTLPRYDRGQDGLASLPAAASARCSAARTTMRCASCIVRPSPE
jgi:hypothetical protein